MVGKKKFTNLRASLTAEDMKLLRQIQDAMQRRLDLNKVSQTAVLRRGIKLAAAAEGLISVSPE
jgi:hypothetical protein